jgi:hypothetical protein
MLLISVTFTTHLPFQFAGWSVELNHGGRSMMLNSLFVTSKIDNSQTAQTMERKELRKCKWIWSKISFWHKRR